MPKHIRNGKIVGGAIGIASNLFFDKTKKNLLAAENVQDAVDELSEGINNNANNAALASQTLGYSKKNLIPYPYYDKAGADNESPNVTWVDNGDGSISANGSTNTDIIASYEINNCWNATHESLIELEMGKEYIISGCPSGSSATTYGMQILAYSTDGTRSYINVFDEPVKIIGSTNVAKIGIRINVEKNMTVNNLKFYPMLRDANIIDDTWEPYVPSVDERINALWAAINELNSQG